MNYLNMLNDKGMTCIIFDQENIIFESTKKGVAPLLEFLNKNETYDSLVLADKIIGKGAVILAKLIGITHIHTPVISKDALQLANDYEIKCTYQSLVPFIRNRDNTGRCPIESCVLSISDPEIGLQAILNTLKKLQKAT